MFTYLLKIYYDLRFRGLKIIKDIGFIGYDWHTNIHHNEHNKANAIAAF